MCACSLKNVVRLAAVGQSLLEWDISRASSTGLRAIRCLLRSCDAAFTNLEGCIDTGEPTKERFFHGVTPEVLDSFSWLGLNLISLANNHAFDSGSSGLLSTLKESHNRDLVLAGAGHNLQQASAPAYCTVSDVRVALVAAVSDATWLPDIAYATDDSERIAARAGVNPLRIDSVRHILPEEEWQTLGTLADSTGATVRSRREAACGWHQNDGETTSFFGVGFARGSKHGQDVVPNPQDYDRFLESIALARRKADIVLVSHHDHIWSNAWQDVLPWKRRLAHDCIDSGAFAFLGHGVPAASGIEVYKRRPILYSLGNFIFQETTCAWAMPEVWESYLGVFDIESTDRWSLSLTPIDLGSTADPGLPSCRTGGLPQPSTGARADQILKMIEDLSKPFGTCIERCEDTGVIRP